jgi:hypothetical protein
VDADLLNSPDTVAKKGTTLKSLIEAGLTSTPDERLFVSSAVSSWWRALRPAA